MPGEYWIEQLQEHICNLIRSKGFEQISALASGGAFVGRELGRVGEGDFSSA